MQVVKARVRPSSAAEQVEGRKASVFTRNVVVEIDGMKNGLRPETGVGLFRPVDGSVEHLGAGDGHNGADGCLGASVGVVLGCSCELDDLTISSQSVGEVAAGERTALIGSVSLDLYPIVLTQELELLLRLQSLMRVEMNLIGNMNETGGAVNEDCSTRVHIGI